MPREVVVVSVGQCGNQIGSRFWDLALREHALANKDQQFDGGMSVLFRNVDTKHSHSEISFSNGTQKISSLRARAVLIDMEEGVTRDISKGSLGPLFDERQYFMAESSGSGNNWAQGYAHFGPRYRDQLNEKIRESVEACDSLQCFLLLHSLGGGTGSGVGSYLLEGLADEYPEIYRFVAAVTPSLDDDVITSPYNSCLSLNILREHADCVIPFSNDSLLSMAERLEKSQGKEKGTGSVPDTRKSRKPWKQVNGLIASVLTDLTSSMRFSGPMNVDLNEITTNLVPFPSLHFLVSAVSPLNALPDSMEDLRKKPSSSTRFEQLLADVVSPSQQLVNAQIKATRSLAAAFLVRGDVAIADVTTGVERIKHQLRMLPWNQSAFKVGMCSTPPLGQSLSVLALNNSCGVRTLFESILTNFNRLFRRRAHLHHYLDHIETDVLSSAENSLRTMIRDYTALDRDCVPPAPRAKTIAPTSTSRGPSDRLSVRTQSRGATATRLPSYFATTGLAEDLSATPFLRWLQSPEAAELTERACLSDIFRLRPSPLC